MAKIELQDFVKYGKLFEVYGKLLSEDRQKIMSLYFDFNMTLAEIADEKKISRQAVLDAVGKSCHKLEEYENVLKIAEKNQILSEKLREICDDKNCTKEIKSKVEKILREL